MWTQLSYREKHILSALVVGLSMTLLLIVVFSQLLVIIDYVFLPTRAGVSWSEQSLRHTKGILIFSVIIGMIMFLIGLTEVNRGHEDSQDQTNTNLECVQDLLLWSFLLLAPVLLCRIAVWLFDFIGRVLRHRQGR